MAVTTGWYSNGLKHLMQGDCDLVNDNHKIALFTVTHSRDVDADEFFNALANEVVAGNGYTAGGEVIAGEAVTLVQDGSATAHAVSTSYDVGDIVRPSAANGYVYRAIAITTGISSGTPPTWPTTVGVDVTDGGVTWENLGTAFVKFDFTDPSWTPNTTITARSAIVYRDGATPGTDDYLLGYIDFGQDESSTNGDFDIILPADGMLQLANS